jgi:F-type H+-transporting ATPase subunit b
MDLITPGIGLIFWTTIIFILLLLILKKFAWKPIISAIDSRNKSIEDALLAAEKTKAEMVSLQANNEKIMQEARQEYDSLIKEARETKDQIIAQAKESASLEAEKIIAHALQAIEAEKRKVIAELTSTVTEISIDIAEKILKKELSDVKASEKIISDSLKDLQAN